MPATPETATEVPSKLRHAEDCDGFAGVHDATAVKAPDGTWDTACLQGCDLAIVGSFGSRASAVAEFPREHFHWDSCTGECVAARGEQP